MVGTEMKAVVTTAKKLNQNQMAKVAELIKKKKTGSFEIEYVVDKKIIGGISILIGDLLYDGTILSELKSVSGALKD